MIDFVPPRGGWDNQKLHVSLLNDVWITISTLVPPVISNTSDMSAWKHKPDGTFSVSSTNISISSPPMANDPSFNLSWCWKALE